MRHSSFTRAATGFVMAAALLAAGSIRAAEEIDYQKFVDDHSPPIVTVKFLLKISMGGMGEEENETEVAGVMIDPAGLVLCSNTEMGGIVGMMRRMMGGAGDEMKAVPTDLKVLVGEDTEGIAAEIVARDSDLDLAWVRIKDAGGKKFASVDFAQGVRPALGEPILSVRRMPKFFDRAPTFGQGRICGITKKPRELFIPLGGTAGLGEVAFTREGKAVGITILQTPDASEEGGEGGGMGRMMEAMSGMSATMTGVLLPAAEVVKATARALEAGGDAKPGTDTKPDAESKKE